MLNDRLLQAQQKYSDETRMWVALRRGGIEDLTPERVAEVLGRYNDQTVQDVLDLWSNFDMQLDPDLASGDVNQVLGEQVVSAAADAKAAADRLDYGKGGTEDAWHTTWSTLNNKTNGERHDRPGWTSEIQNLSEFTAMLPEIAATADYITRLRDPESRNSATFSQVHDGISFAKNLSSNISASKVLFARLRESGVDPAPLEKVVREQLDKHGLGDLLDIDASPPSEMRAEADKSLVKFRNAQDTDKPAEKESLELVDTISAHMSMSNSAMTHQTYANVVGQVVDYQRAHGGVSPKLSQAVQQAAANDRFGFMHDTLVGLELDAAVKDGDAEKVSDLTGGKQALVQWDTEVTTLSPDLVADDRSGASTEKSVLGDIMFREGMAETTPNVAAALNSMYAAYGGGIHRTDNNITEADVPAAQRWKQDAAQWRSNEGSADDRRPDQVTGVYSGRENLLVVADATFSEGTIGVTNTISHELGHALDSMLADITGTGGYHSRNDAEYAAFRTKLKEIASYGDTPDDTLLNWYYRDGDEGASTHNGYSGTVESWAQGYAAYAGMRRMMGENEGNPEEAWRRSVFAKGGQSLLYGHNSEASSKDLSLRDRYLKAQEAGQAIWEFFDDFENRRLPEIMQTPVAVKKRASTPSTASTVSTALGAPPPAVEQRLPNAVQIERISKHNHAKHGELNMIPLEPGSPEAEQVLADMRAANPKMAPPPRNALAVTYNADWKTQGATVLWKAAKPGDDTPVSMYSDEHKKTQHAAKFQRQQGVDQVVGRIREQALSEALDSPVAALVALLAETGMRVGGGASVNPKTKKKEPTFGATTLQRKHVFFPSDTLMRIKFIGKSHKENVYETRDPVLREAMKQLIAGKKPSEQVFAGVNPNQTQQYARDVSGMPNLINHDLRTYRATDVARQLVKTWPKSKMPKDELSFKKVQRDIAKKAGDAINDNWDTALNSYISPNVWEPMERSAGLPFSFDDSPPYGLIEGDVVQSIGGPPVGGPAAPAGETPAAPVAASAEPPDSTEDDAPIPPMDFSPAAVAERHNWYAAYQWPGDKVVPPPLPEEIAEDEGDEEA